MSPEKYNPEEVKTDRTVLYADLDDEIATLISNVKKARGKRIVIVVPRHAHILQSLTSLKILGVKVKNLGKELTLATRDDAGRAIAREAGITTATHVEILGSHITVHDEAEEKPREKLGRKTLTLNEDPAVKAAGELIDRTDIPLSGTTVKERVQKIWRFLSGERAESGDVNSPHLIVRAPSRGLLGTMLGAAAALLIFITYIAAPTATVQLTPRSDPISQVLSLTLHDNDLGVPLPTKDNLHIIPSTFFSFDITQEILIGATGQEFQGTNAKGTVTLFNKSPRDKYLVPSRLLSNEGIVFKMDKAVTIPAAAEGVPGSFDVAVTACERDDPKCDCTNKAACKGDFVGARGNIGKSFFTIPGLNVQSPALYYGESSSPMTGGTTKVLRHITQDDLDNVRLSAERDIVPLAKEALAKAISEKEIATKTPLSPLDEPKAFTVTVTDVKTPEGLKDTYRDNFPVTVSARVTGVAYETDRLRSLLLEELKKKVHPDKILSLIHYDGMVMKIDELKPDEGKIRASVSIEGQEQYDVNELSDKGSTLTNKIRSRILGLSIDEAEAYVKNLPEVQNANISSWPFWAQSVPTLPESVKFRVTK